MISSLHLNKLTFLIIFFTALNFCSASAEDEAVDIWKKEENKNEQNTQMDSEKDITIESPILSEDVNKIIIKIDESDIKNVD